jgi:hypothetical protein
MMATDNDKRRRNGKTAKDRRNGYESRRNANRDARNAYCNNQKAENREFPFHACNGKRNRYRVTGPNGQTVFVKRV